MQEQLAKSQHPVTNLKFRVQWSDLYGDRQIPTDLLTSIRSSFLGPRAAIYVVGESGCLRGYRSSANHGSAQPLPSRSPACSLPNPCNLLTGMENSDDAKLNSFEERIRMLTTVCQGTVESPEYTGSNGKVAKHSDIYHHIALLLSTTIGAPSDPRALRVVAVTGNITAQVVNIVVVASNPENKGPDL